MTEYLQHTQFTLYLGTEGKGCLGQDWDVTDENFGSCILPECVFMYIYTHIENLAEPGE